MDSPQDSVPPSPRVERPVYGAEPPQEIEQNEDARNWGMLVHLAGLCGLLGVPSIFGPLVIWLMKKDEYPFVDDQGKEAVNFHIGLMIAAAICIPAICCFLIGLFLLIAIGIFALVMTIIAAVTASRGEYYRYPLNMRLIK